MHQRVVLSEQETSTPKMRLVLLYVWERDRDSTLCYMEWIDMLMYDADVVLVAQPSNASFRITLSWRDSINGARSSVSPGQVRSLCEYRKNFLPGDDYLHRGEFALYEPL